MADPSRHLLTILVGMLMLLPPAGMPAAEAAAYRDVRANTWFGPYVDYLSERRVVAGYPDNTFRPQQQVSRAEFAAMLARSQKLPMSQPGRTGFRDVPQGHWAANAIRAVAARGWLTGYPNHTFHPAEAITMAELYTVAAKILPAPDLTRVAAEPLLRRFIDHELIPGWARQPVATAVRNGTWVSEDAPERLDPISPATRAEVSTVIAKLMNEGFRTPPGVAAGRYVNATGELQRDETSGAWEVRAGDETYVIAGPAEFDPAQFHHGQTVAFAGTVNAQGEIRIDRLGPHGAPASETAEPITVRGILQPTVEAGGWMLTTGGARYVLMELDETVTRNWFRPGADVRVTGTVHENMITVYMEGTPLVVRDIQPTGAGGDR